jgi:hypothetical protein
VTDNHDAPALTLAVNPTAAPVVVLTFRGTDGGGTEPLLYAKVADGGLTTRLGCAETVSVTGIMRGLFPALVELTMIEDWYTPTDNPLVFSDAVNVAGVVLELPLTVRPMLLLDATTENGTALPSLLARVIC